MDNRDTFSIKHWIGIDVSQKTLAVYDLSTAQYNELSNDALA